MTRLRTDRSRFLDSGDLLMAVGRRHGQTPPSDITSCFFIYSRIKDFLYDNETSV